MGGGEKWNPPTCHKVNWRPPKLDRVGGYSESVIFPLHDASAFLIVDHDHRRLGLGTLCGIMLGDCHMQLEFCQVLADLCSARLNDWHHVNKSIVLIILWFLAVFISTHSHFNSVHNILNVYKMSLVVNYLIANLNRTTMISFPNSIISKGFLLYVW